jgi:hypothetical protein
LHNWQHRARTDSLSAAAERDREYLAVLERLRSAASAKMHQTMGVCCSDIADFLGIASITCLRFVSKDMSLKLMHARTKSWGILQLQTFGESEMLIKNLLKFLASTNHAHVRVKVKEGIGVSGFIARGMKFQDHRPIYGTEYDLPQVQALSLVNTSKAILLQRDLPYRAELEVFSKMQNLKQVQFVRLSVSNDFIARLSFYCPHVESLSMIHCKGNQDSALALNGSFLKGFQKLRDLHIDFHIHGAYSGWPGLNNRAFLEEVLSHLEVLSVRGNMQDRLILEDYERMISRAQRLKELHISPFLDTTAMPRGVKVVVHNSKCDKEFPVMVD